jgi:hypothetical protein
MLVNFSVKNKHVTLQVQILHRTCITHHGYQPTHNHNVSKLVILV